MATEPFMTEVAGIRVRVSEDFTNEIRYYLNAGDYEWAEMRVVREQLLPDDIVMEFGAGLGIVSAYCARVVGSERVFAYEANPRLESHLRGTYALNNVDPSLTMCAVASRAGGGTFFIRDAFWESSALDDGSPHSTIEVPMLAANDEIRKHNPSFLIIDIEGGECDLFRDIDLRGIDKVLIETHARKVGREPIHVVLGILRAAGFDEVESLAYNEVLFFRRRPDIERCVMDGILQQWPIKHPNAREKPLTDGSLLLVHLDTWESLTLNPLAAFLWHSSTGRDTVGALVREVHSLFPEQEGVEGDVLSLVRALTTKGFLALSRTPKGRAGNPFDFFDGIFSINLDSQPDRWRDAMNRYRMLGIESRVERFTAPPTPDNKYRGSALSWRRLVAEATRRGYEHVLGFEDDAIFLDDTLAVVGAAVAELADLEWDLLYLGAAVWSQDFPFVEGSAVLQECGSLTCCHAMAVHRRAYARILADIPSGGEELEAWLGEWLAHDQYLRQMIEDGTYRALIVSPRVATQPHLIGGHLYDSALTDHYVI